MSGSWAGEGQGGEWELGWGEMERCVGVGLGRDGEVSGSWAEERWRGEWEACQRWCETISVVRVLVGGCGLSSVCILKARLGQLCIFEGKGASGVYF